ncbi:MAG: hypothetical protein LBB52_08980 [Desulfovibrio sp.]|jgi:hypothetical protein|nr:hypothetical protein [Desulfovibrio sp.]
MKKILYVGLDVHKRNTSIACGSEGEDMAGEKERAVNLLPDLKVASTAKVTYLQNVGQNVGQR